MMVPSRVWMAPYIGGHRADLMALAEGYDFGYWHPQGQPTLNRGRGGMGITTLRPAGTQTARAGVAALYLNRHYSGMRGAFTPSQRYGMAGLASTNPGVEDLIRQMAARYGVDPALALAVARNESGFNQSAESPKGAIGVFQLMPPTASDMGVDPYDLEQNVEGGVKYLRLLLNRYDGDVPAALAAYNEGMGNYERGYMPAETSRYVSAIMGEYGAGTPTPIYGPVNPDPTGDPGDPGGYMPRYTVTATGAMPTETGDYSPYGGAQTGVDGSGEGEGWNDGPQAPGSSKGLPWLVAGVAALALYATS